MQAWCEYALLSRATKVSGKECQALRPAKRKAYYEADSTKLQGDYYACSESLGPAAVQPCAWQRTAVCQANRVIEVA